MENIQLYPAKVRVVPNVKLVKNITELDAEDYQDMLDGYESGVIEKRNHKKAGRIISPYKIVNADGYTGTNPLTEFDAAVLSACISEQKIGNTDTTPAVILRALTGKTRKTSNGALNKNQRRAILDSVEKLMCTKITADLSAVNEALGYHDGKKQKITSTILPCDIITTTVNGQPVDDVIHFRGVSPIMQIAEDRDQILRYDTDLLDVPNQNNTPLVIVLKNYCMRRVAEINAHKMTPTLTFADIFKRARISDASNRVKFEARAVVEKFFEHLQSKDAVKTFELVKRGAAVYAVKFTF